jgi:hypothetical protein
MCVHSTKDTAMNFVKVLLVSASIGSLSLPGLASAECSHSTRIKNDSNVTLRIVELKSSSSPPFFKTQWTGLRTIRAGDTGTIDWTSDLDCTDDSNVPNIFDVKLVRSIGKVHSCDNLQPSEAVTLEAPDLCFH